MLDTKLEPAVAKDMVKGAPDRLWSEFHLSYNMLLNLARAEARRTEPDAVIRSSFLQFQTQRSLPTLLLRAQLKVRLAQLCGQTLTSAPQRRWFRNLVSR